MTKDTPDQHFNGLTPAEAERLALLAEECGECVQAIGKILRHGYESRHPLDGTHGTTNRESLEREVGDIYTAIWMMFEAKDIRRLAVAHREDVKRESVKRYTHHQEKVRA